MFPLDSRQFRPQQPSLLEQPFVHLARLAQLFAVVLVRNDLAHELQQQRLENARTGPDRS